MNEWLTLVLILTQIVVTVCVPFITYYMRKLEKNTNSMREQLVEATARLGIAAGIKQEKERAEKEKGHL